MKNLFKPFLSILLLSVLLVACGDDETAPPVTIDGSVPTGVFAKSRSGSLVAENGTPTAGLVEIGTDEDGEYFLHFGSDFKTEQGTGTVTVYFSTSSTFTADPGAGNPDLKLVGVVAENGEQYIKLDEAVEGKFTHLILWCGSANVPFGNAALN